MSEFNQNVLVDSEVSVSLQELKAVLDYNIVNGSTILSAVIDGVLIESRIVSISPSLAEAMLTRNLKNRPITQGNVNKLASAMVKNEWKFDGMPINFDKYGKLMNGQHRLSAIVKSGKTNIFNVMVGFKSEIFSTMDVGKSRTSSEILAIAGISNYKLCAQTSNFIFKFNRGLISTNASKPSRNNGITSNGLSHPELLEFVKDNSLIKESVDFYLGIRKTMPMSILPSYVVSGFYYLFAEKDKEDAKTFLTKLLIGDRLSLDEPIYHLRNRLVNAKSDKIKNRLYHNEMVKLSIMAWNKYRNGETIKTLKIPESLPKIL